MNIVNPTQTPEDLLQQGNRLRQAKKLDEAIAIFQQVIQLQGNNVWAYQYWGETLVQKGELTAAESCYLKAIAIAPDFPWTHHCLAQVLFWQEKIAESIAASQQAISLDGNQANFHYQLGQALEKQGELAGAIDRYQRALELKPDMEQARQHLQQAIAKQPKVNQKTQVDFKVQSQKPEKQNHNISILSGRQYLKELFSATPKLLIATQNQQILDFLSSIKQITLYEYRPHQSSTGGIIVPLGKQVDEQLVEMELTPTFCLGFLVTSASEQNVFEPLIEWWRKKCSPEDLPAYLKVNSGADMTQFPANFWQLMFQRSIGQTEATAQRISLLQKQYLELRTLHENTQNAFAVVEDYLSQAKLPSLQLAFEYPPEQEYIALKSESTTFTVKQLLPISSRTIAAVELHIADIHPKAQGTLVIKLKALDDDRFLANWAVPYSHLSPGWLKLDVPQIDLGYQKEVELLIEGITRISPSPSLSLGKVQLILEARVQLNEMSQERSLALRLWKGLPGTRRAISPYTTFTSFSASSCSIPNDLKLGYLGQITMSGVVEITPNLPQDDFLHIEVIEEGRKILTHPRYGGEATIAMLPFCLPPKVNQLVATVATEHPEAGVIEYALAVIEEGIDPLTCFEPKNLTPAKASSGWIAVEPNNQRQISLSIAPVEQHRHIVMAAKLPVNGSYSFAWAHWLNFWLGAESD